ncbi:unnamed protein product [Closterium sp. Naga37s-1]|nr:unnamed protein product [Closterium sp. Naga37s-1]
MAAVAQNSAFLAAPALSSMEQACSVSMSVSLPTIQAKQQRRSLVAVAALTARDLQSKSLEQLRAMARMKGITGNNKAQLISALTGGAAASKPSSYASTAAFSGDEALLQSKTLGELRALASAKGLRGDTKAEIIKLLLSVGGVTPAPAAPAMSFSAEALSPVVPTTQSAFARLSDEMAATLSSSASASLRSLSVPEGSTLATSSRAAIPAFSGLKAHRGLSASAGVQTCTCVSCGRSCACPCAKCGNRRTSIVAMASGDSQFASVSQSTAAPAAPATSALIPAVVGAGALGAATYVAVKKLTASPAAAPAAPAPSPPAVTSVPPSGIVPRAKHAAASALATMATTFPSAMQEEAFLKAVAVELAKLGFRKDNGIALVNTCRDEVCRPVVSIIDREFGLSFNISGLGGLVNCGKVGFGAAMSHSPEFPCDVDGNLKERYIFFAFPHVSIGESGEVGSLLRRGRGKASSACGALIAINNDINNGVAPSMDSDDPEYTLLRKKIMAKVSGGDQSLVDVTRAALAAINEDLEKLISLTVNPATADYAVITGVQIHSGDQIPGQPFRIERTCDYIAPDKMYAVVRGQKYELKVETPKSQGVAAMV